MKFSENGAKLLKEVEGLRLKPYYCTGGKLTIGFGHTSNVTKDMVITEEEALKFLYEDMKVFEDVVNSKVKIQLTQNEFDALCIFVYNLGEGAFSTSTLLKKLNNNEDREEVSKEFLKFNKVRNKNNEK